MIPYNAIRSDREFNVDSKAQCDHLNLAHVARNKNVIKKKLKQTNASVHLVRYRFKISKGSPKGTRKTTAERICERD